MKRYSAPIIAAAIMAVAPASHAATAAGIRYAAVPAWVLPPPPAVAMTIGSSDAPFRIAYNDTQVRAGRNGMEIYGAYRVKLLKPEALAAGNIAVTWNPSVGEATVHYLRIIRAGQVIDVLKTTRFRVLQREGGLEQSILTGQLTATIQTPGLQVGDEIEFAATIKQGDAALGYPAFGFSQLPIQGLPGDFRFRLLWPEAQPMVWRTTKDIPALQPVAARGGEKELVYELHDPSSVVLTEEAPARYNVRRVVEFSTFATWGEVSRRVWPLFDKAATPASNSPIRTEAAKIMATTPDPAARALAALRLTQEQIRYVYVGMDGGHIAPASADETWQRRFGDCKGKTVVLLALLRQMGIEAEPVLVNSKGGDGTDERLPQPGWFDHVLVRAKIGGQRYWLDGTRPADRTLTALSTPDFRWALPISVAGSDLEKVVPKPLTLPQFIGVIEIDSTAGIDKPSKVKAQNILRGDDAYTVRSQLAGMPAADAERAVQSFWRQDMPWVEPEKVAWRYDEAQGVLVLSVTGEGKADWEETETGHRMLLPGAGFTPPSIMKRPKDQDQTANWVTDFPRYRCWVTTVRMPAPGPGLYWDFFADRMNRQLAGADYWRNSGLRQNVVRTVMSRRIYLPELTPADAEEVNRSIDGFNNNKSQVFEERKGRPSSADVADGGSMPFSDTQDWVNDPSPCAAPPGAPIMK